VLSMALSLTRIDRQSRRASLTHGDAFCSVVKLVGRNEGLC
jgi:hypothetical protein